MVCAMEHYLLHFLLLNKWQETQKLGFLVKKRIKGVIPQYNLVLLHVVTNPFKRIISIPFFNDALRIKYCIKSRGGGFFKVHDIINAH